MVIFHGFVLPIPLHQLTIIEMHRRCLKIPEILIMRTIEYAHISCKRMIDGKKILKGFSMVIFHGFILPIPLHQLTIIKMHRRCFKIPEISQRKNKF